MVIDFQHYLLLDCLNLVGILGGVLGLLCIPDLNLNAGLMGAGLGGGLLLSIYLIILLLFRKKGMGLGDIKTAIMCGLYLNPINIILVFLIASFIGVIWGIVRIFLGKGRTMPFGTLMGISSIIMVFWGEKIIGWIYR
jgi:leader peptidase (prepilin peptidase)/N-methyltransferase